MLKRILPLFLLLTLSVPAIAQVVQRPVEQVAYDQALLLAARSQRVHETLKPVVVREIVGLVSLSKIRPLTPPEKARLIGLDALRKSADIWVTVHNAYLDILGGIDHLLEKPVRDARDNRRLTQLLAGLPRSNLKLDRAMGSVQTAARNLGLKIEEF